MPEARLLIMACGARKRAMAASAVGLYDGPAYRLLRRRNRRGFASPGTPVLILSAEHGLISPDSEVESYNRKMDESRAEELAQARATERARALVGGLPGWPFARVFFHGGTLYRLVIGAYEQAGVFGAARVEYSSGAIGEQLSQLKKFLGER